MLAFDQRTAVATLASYPARSEPEFVQLRRIWYKLRRIADEAPNAILPSHRVSFLRGTQYKITFKVTLFGHLLFEDSLLVGTWYIFYEETSMTPRMTACDRGGWQNKIIALFFESC